MRWMMTLTLLVGCAAELGCPDCDEEEAYRRKRRPDLSEPRDLSPPPPDPTPPPSSGAPTIAGCQVFPADNPWNADISTMPVDPNSANFIAHMNGGTRFLHPDFGSNPAYGIPYITVPGTQTKVPMSFD